MSDVPLYVKCDRYSECKERHDMLVDRVQELEREKREDLRQLWTSVRSIESTLSALSGRLAGYLVAAGLLGTAVAFLAQQIVKR